MTRIRRGLKLTQLQRKVLKEVKEYKEEYKAPPSLADIESEIGASPEEERIILRTVKKGKKATKAIKSLKKRKFVRELKPHGGLVLTKKGERLT